MGNVSSAIIELSAGHTKSAARRARPKPVLNRFWRCAEHQTAKLVDSLDQRTVKRKWFTRVVVATALIDALDSLDLRYPEVGEAQRTGVAKRGIDSKRRSLNPNSVGKRLPRNNGFHPGESQWMESGFSVGTMGADLPSSVA
jgi:hypothetical protein